MVREGRNDRLEAAPCRIGPEEKESGNRDALRKAKFHDRAAYRGFTSTRGTVKPQYPLESDRSLYCDPIHDVVENRLASVSW